MKKETVEQETEKRIKIIENKIKSALLAEGKETNDENMWKGAFSVFVASIRTNCEHAEESLQIVRNYAPESFGESCNEVREALKRYSMLTQQKAWENKAFYSLVLKTMFTEEGCADQECVDRILELSVSESPKVRKAAIPTLRRVMQHESRSAGESRTFNRLVQMVVCLQEGSAEHSGRAISVLNQLHQEISKYGAAGQMIEIAQHIQNVSESASVPVVTFIHALIENRAPSPLQKYAVVLNTAMRKGCRTSEEAAIVFRSLGALFKESVTREVKGEEEFVIGKKGSETEELIKEIFEAEVERSKPEHLKIEACLAVHALLEGAKTKISVCLRKLVASLATYCVTEKDMRVSKEIELVIGHIGVEAFIETVGEGELLFWAPMMKAAVHSTDIEVFRRLVLPEISRSRRRKDEESYASLWGCFPAFCRNTTDRRRMLPKILVICAEHLGSQTARGHIAQGLSSIIEDGISARANGNREDGSREGGSREEIVKAVADATYIFERIASSFKQEPTEAERQYIRGMMKIVSPVWKEHYVKEIVEASFHEMEELAGELRPEYQRKENDVPECERAFVENGHLLEIIAPELVNNSEVIEGVLKYCLSTHLRTQKMAYKVVLGLIEGGFCPKSLVEFFFNEKTDKVMFLCSRYLRVQVLYALLNRHRIEEAELVCRAVFEAIGISRTEGGKNRKIAYDMAADMTVRYGEEKLNEVCKMALAGIPNGNADYQAGAICFLTTLLYNGAAKIREGTFDMIFEAVDALSAENKYATSKAIIGYLSTLLTSTPHMDRYLNGSLVCIDRVIFHFKQKLHENIKLLLRKILEKRNIGEKLSYVQKELLKHKPQNRTEEKDRVFVEGDGKIVIKDQEVIKREKAGSRDGRDGKRSRDGRDSRDTKDRRDTRDGRKDDKGGRYGRNGRNSGKSDNDRRGQENRRNEQFFRSDSRGKRVKRS